MASVKIKTATLGGTVWSDSNHDGLQNDGNIGIAGVKVLLLNDEGKATGKFAISDANGNYSFAGLKPGEYSVKFDAATLPNGATFTQKDVGRNNNIDSDANVTTGKTGTVELKAGDVNTSVDAGVVLPPEPAKATIGNFVWLDANANGIQDNGEVGIANQVVSLLDSQDRLVDSVVTDNNGAYSFTVTPGDYKVNFFKPNQFYTFSPQQQGLDDKLDSNVDPNTFQALVTVKAGEVNNTIDAGLINSPISIGASRGVWLDNNPSSGDRLGVKDADESGIAGVTVTLTGAGADNLFDTADDMRLSMVTTDTGDYRFDNLPNDQNYRLQFSGLAANQQFTIKNALSASTHGSSIPNDSDVDANGVAAFVNNALPGHISAGVVLSPEPVKATIGNFVWLDANANGIQDAGENGLANITLHLTRILPNGGIASISQTTTDSNGHYSFTGLEPGQYQFFISDTQGHVFSPPNQGTDPNLDSDVVPSTVEPTVGFSPVLTVAAGENNSTVDVGLIPSTQVQATLNGHVWLDDNGNGIQDTGEQGLPGGIDGVVVTLNNQAGGVTFVNLDNNGNYSVKADPGSYTLSFFGFGNIHNATLKNQGTDDSIDSDVAMVDTHLQSDLITVEAGKIYVTDAGFIKDPTAPITISGRSWSDDNANGIQDASEPAYPNAPIDIYKLDSNNAPVLVLHTSTDSNGAYSFTDNSPGQFFVHVPKLPIFDYTLFHQGSNELLNSDINPTSGDSNLITLAAGESATAIDVGLVSPGQLQPGTITGHVWKDDNSNGIQDPSEAGYAGVEVILLDSPLGTVNTITTTDSNGDYVFTGVTPADYLIQFSGSDFNYFTPTLLHQGSDPNKDSDYDPSFTGTNNQVTVHTSETIKFDAGYLKAPPINIGATRGVWLDANGDSLKDADATLEPGIEGITVTLINKGADGVFGGVDDTVVASTTTNTNGDYNFPGVDRAAYALVFSKPGSTVTFTAMHNDNLTRGDIASDSDANGLGQVISVDNTQPDFISAGIISIVGIPPVI